MVDPIKPPTTESDCLQLELVTYWLEQISDFGAWLSWVIIIDSTYWRHHCCQTKRTVA